MNADPFMSLMVESFANSGVLTEKRAPIIAQHSTVITYLDVPMVCWFDYAPGEPKTQDHPGCASEAFFISAYAGVIDISPLLREADRKAIEARICDQMEG